MTDVMKTSDEIISELFDSITAIQSSHSCDEEESEIVNEKKRKQDEITSESKPRKKKRKRSGSNDDSDGREGKRKKKKKKHKHSHKKKKEEKKKRKKRHKHTAGDLSNGPSDAEVDPSTNSTPNPVDASVQKSLLETAKDSIETANPSTGPVITHSRITSPSNADIVPSKVADAFVEDLIAEDPTATMSLTNQMDKSKTIIKIMDLKHSHVLEKAEEQAKLIAEKYEDGEISDSNSSTKPVALPDGSEHTTKLDDSSVCSVNGHTHKSHKSRSKSSHHKSKTKHSSKKKESKRRGGSRSEKKSSKKRKNHSESDESVDSKTVENPSESGEKRTKSRSRERICPKDSNNVKKDHCAREESDRSKGKLRKERSRSRSRGKHKKSEGHSVSSRKDDSDKESSKERRKSRSPRSPRKNRSRGSRRSRTPTHSKHHSSSRNRSKDEYFIDKSKLLEIARKNALNMMKQGQVGTDLNKVAAITAGGKTVDELTDFCKLLSQKEATGQESISSECSSGDEGERAFHHPFQLKEKPNNIVMNIRNCASLPVKSHLEKTTEQAQQLRLQFPVSSGQHHRKTENQWIPVKKTEVKAIMPPSPPPLPPVAPDSSSCSDMVPVSSSTFSFANIPLPPVTYPPAALPAPPNHTQHELGHIISQRLEAIQKQHELASNPALYQLNNPINIPRLSFEQTGLFTGSTGARVLTQAELASGQQAWAKKDQLICAQPVSGGMGMSLLQKMGWRPGEGLGKNNEGTLEPLKLQVKMDKRGLVCADELHRRQRQMALNPPKSGNVAAAAKSLEGKHPVSLLVEYCSKKHYPTPVFTVCFEEGPPHKKNFIFKVTVNGIDFQPTAPSPNKKQAKSEAANVCLRKLGILPFAHM